MAMLFANDDDDADFTVQPGGSKLASLFSDNEAAKAGNSSLTYTPPKQPSVGKSFDKQPSSGTLSLLHAGAVQAFKYEGKKPSNVGRLGVAVLGNHEKRTYKLILYKEKQQQVAVAAINAQFVIRLFGNNFLSFADEKRCNWSLKFGSEEAVISFAKQAVIAKALSLGGSLTELNYYICQDLVVPGEGDGDSLVHGSSAVIKYTAWLLTSEHSLKKVFDTTESDEPQKIKIGRGKHVKGLEEGLLGCKKNSRRLLVLPPSFGYGSKGLGTTIPPDSVLVYDVSVSSVSKPKPAAKDSTRRSSTPVSAAAVDADKREARSSSHGSSADESARSRAPSAPPDWPPQQPATAPSLAPVAAASGGESDKARLLSRMAKIGAQMLPMPGAVPAQPSSDSEVEDERLPSIQVPTTVPLPQPAVREGSPKPVVKPRSFSQQSSGDTVLQPTPMQPALQPMASAYTPGLPPAAAAMPAAQHMSLYQAQTQLAGALAGYPYQQQGILLPPPHAYPAAPVPTSVSTALDAQLPVLLSETRSQSTEVRLNISKLTDKVDYIIGKLDTLKSQPPSAPPLSSYMDSEALLHNIQRIVQENVKLKNESSEKNNKIQALNEKICDLLQRNQRLMEESNTLFEQRSDTLHSSAAHSQARLLALEAEKMEVSEQLNRTLSELSLLKAELSERQHKESQAQKMLGELQSVLQDNNNMLKSLEDSLKEAEQEKQDLEKQIEGYKDAASVKENAAHSSEQIAQLEENISAHWKSMCDTETKKLSARISALEAEKEALSARVMELDSKCKELATSGEKQRQAYEDKMRQLQQENQALSTGAAAASAAFDFDTELKKIMNTLFKLLQREFSLEETYSSKEAKGIVLNSIRDYTTAVLERRQASATLGNGTSRASPTSTSSNSSTAGPPAAAAAAAAAAASQPQQSSGGGGNQEGKHQNMQESPETQPAVEKLSSSPPSGPSAPSQHDECAEPTPEDSRTEASSNEVVQASKEGEPNLPQEPQDVAPTGDEKAAAKEGASGDAETSSPPPESKTEAEPQAESKNAQPPDWESFLASLRQASRVYGQNIPPLWMTLLSLAVLFVSLLALRYGLYC
ncbi:FK506-binding protein 15-like isoform X3 [Amblyomma americanum]